MVAGEEERRNKNRKKHKETSYLSTGCIPFGITLSVSPNTWRVGHVIGVV